jgi:hemin uptake protein HemP
MRPVPASPAAASESSGNAVPPPIARVASRDLLGSAGQIVITHAGREYRLRITQNGKLILTA